MQGLTGRAWDEFHCLRGKLRYGFELREWTIPKEVVSKVTHKKISIYKMILIQKGKDGKKWMPICGMFLVFMYGCSTPFKKLEDSIMGLWLYHWPLSWFLRIILLIFSWKKDFCVWNYLWNLGLSKLKERFQKFCAPKHWVFLCNQLSVSWRISFALKAIHRWYWQKRQLFCKVKISVKNSESQNGQK